VVGLGLSALLGGLHALTPGHGKTLIAAYLIGSRATVKHAAALGGIVTFTHTASAIAVGLLALFASQVIVPDILVPVLEVGAGLLVVALGVRLVLERWRLRGGAHDHHHDHDHQQLPTKVVAIGLD
jgi:ABC-type nickel/cobalt efflux system permease component RcnA